jgi:hypothetical protein
MSVTDAGLIAIAISFVWLFVVETIVDLVNATVLRPRERTAETA